MTLPEVAGADPDERRTAGRSQSWQLLATAAIFGALGAFFAALVRLSFRALEWVLTGTSADPPVAAMHLPLLRRMMTPALGALLATVVLWAQRRITRRPKPEPYVEYVEAVRLRGGVIPLEANCWRTLSAAFSVASGAAVGREGSMIQFAAAAASACGGWPGPRSLRHKSFLVACGVVGGVTAAYNAPLAAVFFVVEIVLGRFAWGQLPLLGLAAGMGWLVAGTLLGRERLYPAAIPLPALAQVWLLPLIALAAGLAGPGYQWLLASLRWGRRLPAALLWSGLLVGCLSRVDPRVWGNGDVGLRMALAGEAGAQALGRLLGLRLLATVFCVGTGTVGGVFTPTLFAGGAAGALLAHLVPGAPVGLCAVAGMCCLLAAVTHAPCMAALMAVELTGDWRLLPLLLPMALVSRWVARFVSPHTMYAIASQSPEHGGGMSSSSAGR